MVGLTIEERCQFLMKFHRKKVYVHGRGVGILENIFLPFNGIEKIKGYQNRPIGVRVNKKYIEYVDCIFVFPILRHYSEITQEEEEKMSEVNFRLEGIPELEDITWKEREYLISIGIDVPLFFEYDHENNDETAIDLGIAKTIEQCKIL